MVRSIGFFVFAYIGIVSAGCYVRARPETRHEIREERHEEKRQEKREEKREKREEHE